MKKVFTFVLVTLIFGQLAFAQDSSSVRKRSAAIASSIRAGNIGGIGEYSPISYLNDEISDVISFFRSIRAKKPLYWSQRIQVCTTNLVNALRWPNPVAALSPLQHVGILLDSQEVFVDGGGGGIGYAKHEGRPVVCHTVPVYVDKDEDELIKLISCIGTNFSTAHQYSFFDYNCGGFTRDVLLAAGLDIPVAPNAGVGIWYPGLRYQKKKDKIQQSKKFLFRELVPYCLKRQ